MARQLGEEDIVGIIESVNNICNKVYLKSRTEETKDFNSGLSMMLNWAGGLLLASAITILLAVKMDNKFCCQNNESTAEYLFYISLLFPGLGGFLLVLVLFNIMVTKQKFTNYHEKVSKEINQFLINRTKLDTNKGLNLKWRLNDNMYYIMAEKTHFDQQYDR